MQAVGQALRAADVRTIYLVHGSFVGPDALGLFRKNVGNFLRAMLFTRGWIGYCFMQRKSLVVSMDLLNNP